MSPYIIAIYYENSEDMFCQAKIGLAVCQNDQPSVTLYKTQQSVDQSQSDSCLI